MLYRTGLCKQTDLELTGQPCCHRLAGKLRLAESQFTLQHLKISSSIKSMFYNSNKQTNIGYHHLHFCLWILGARNVQKHEAADKILTFNENPNRKHSDIEWDMLP